MDRSELEHELQRLHPLCFAWALGCCRWRQDEAEEVLQVAYLKVLDGSARFACRASFKTFLFGVIRLTAREHWRRWRWQCRRLLAVPDEPAWIEARPSQEEELAMRERAGALLAALRLLPARQREVLELVFYHDLTVREAGEVIGVATGTAAVHYERGKARLRALLDAGHPARRMAHHG
jgi:RNA polymerase sigma-70 factor (ECF subfamily)